MPYIHGILNHTTYWIHAISIQPMRHSNHIEWPNILVNVERRHSYLLFPPPTDLLKYALSELHWHWPQWNPLVRSLALAAASYFWAFLPKTSFTSQVGASLLQINDIWYLAYLSITKTLTSTAAPKSNIYESLNLHKNSTATILCSWWMIRCKQCRFLSREIDEFRTQNS